MEQVYPIFPVEAVLFPGECVEMRVTRPGCVSLFRNALKNREDVGVLFCEDGTLPTADSTGCLARVLECTSAENGSYTVTLEGRSRFRLSLLADDNGEYPRGLGVELTDQDDLAADDPLLNTVGEMARMYQEILMDIDPTVVEDEIRSPVKVKDSFRLIEAILLPEERRLAALETGSIRARFLLALDYFRVEIERLRFLMAEGEEDTATGCMN